MTASDASRSRQFLGSAVDGKRAVADLKRGKRPTYRIGLPHRWIWLPRPKGD